MQILDLENLTEIRGGLMPGGPVGAYLGLLREIETNPQDYTWLMDWYYGR